MNKRNHQQIPSGESEGIICPSCKTVSPTGTTVCPHCGTSLAAATPGEDNTRMRGGVIFKTMDIADLPLGYLLEERYEIIECLGQGGFGVVYRALDQHLETEKALKILPPQLARDPEGLTTLKREARTMASLNHPGLVRLFDLHLTGRIAFLDMEYVPGKPLNQLKIEFPQARMPQEFVGHIALQMAKALSYAHNQGVIHRDIKPANVLLTPGGKVKISDFGIAETVRSSMSRLAQSTSSGTLVYMSPEQLRGKEVGRESDIYSFGALLYDLLSGHPPFYQGDIHYQIFNESPEDIEDVSPGMNAMIHRCLAKDYHERFRSFGEVVAVLQTGESAESESPHIVDEGSRPMEDLGVESESTDQMDSAAEEQDDSPQSPNTGVVQRDSTRQVRKRFWFMAGGAILLLALLLVAVKYPFPKSGGQSANLWISIEPEDATLLVDESPHHAGLLELSSGNYSIEIKKTGFLSERENLKIRAGEKVVRNYRLKKIVGQLILEVAPPDAHLKIDNEDFGSQREINLTPGKHLIELSKAGWHSIQDEVTILPWNPLKKSYHLEQGVGRLRVAVTPADATLKIGDKVYGEKREIDLPSGRYQLQLSKPGWIPINDQVVIEMGKARTRSYTLEGKPANLKIQVKPVDATLQIDGKDYGDQREITLKPGKHRIQLRRPGWILLEDEVTLDAGQNFRKAYELTFHKSMVLVERGSFWMGSQAGGNDERPVHKVTLESFYMDKTEVTQAEYKRVMGKTPSRFTGCDECPVEQVSWFDAIEYCNRRSELEGLRPAYQISGQTVTWDQTANGYRLPTEAEWEYAARGGAKTKGYKYSGSDNLDAVGWYDDNSDSKTHPVKQKQPNELGLYDMSGNVYEWCWDWYDASYYGKSPASNPTGPGKVSYRVHRGGSWGSNASYCRVANRIHITPSYGNFPLGFRVCFGSK